jgi:hypothetical protein
MANINKVKVRRQQKDGNFKVVVEYDDGLTTFKVFTPAQMAELVQ